MNIRAAHISDTEEIGNLCLQLGYDVEEQLVKENLDKLIDKQDNAIYVIENDDTKIIGWVHVYGKHLIETKSYAEIGGLVVDQKYRRLGIGEQLMKMCEDWSVKEGYGILRLRSGISREVAHMFYEKIGYENVKLQKVFEKKLKVNEPNQFHNAS